MWAAIGGIAAGAGALLSGSASSSAAKKAAREQAATTREAIGEERRQFDLNRSDLAPWRDAGGAAIGRMRDLLGIGSGQMTADELMQLDPGYQFGLGEGRKAIENAARARGTFMMPATVKELLRYGQDYASTKFGDIYNRFANVAGTGQTAAFGGAQLGSQSSGRIGDMLTGLGNARGASAIAQGNSWGGAVNTMGNWFQQQSMLNQIRNQPQYQSQGGMSSTPYYGSYGWGNT